jgi:signal transduction histidine kinase
MSAKLLTDSRVGNLNEEQKELVKSIADDSERLLKITGEVLNMSQVETGNIQLKLQPTNATGIIEEALQTVNFSAQQKQIVIKTEIPDNLPLVQADVEKTSWVLINFLTNAIKYSPEKTTITINIVQKNNFVEFIVKDQGNGIEEKYISKIFDRYFKVPGSNENSGTGLGLAISKEFIEAQNGKIWANSNIGEGSTFGFSLATA